MPESKVNKSYSARTLDDNHKIDKLCSINSYFHLNLTLQNNVIHKSL